MSAPSPAVRAKVYERDGERCVSCARRTHLEFQHRKATGSGGSKIRPLYVDGVTSCAWCNPRYEGDLQGRALRFGWKVKSYPLLDPALVPVWYPFDRAWFSLTSVATRLFMPAVQALDLMHAAYGDAYFEFEKGSLL